MQKTPETILLSMGPFTGQHHAITPGLKKIEMLAPSGMQVDYRDTKVTTDTDMRIFSFVPGAEDDLELVYNIEQRRRFARWRSSHLAGAIHRALEDGAIQSTDQLEQVFKWKTELNDIFHTYYTEQHALFKKTGK